MIARLILWVSVIWLVPLMYGFLANETKFKKNIALGVTFPYEGRTHPDTLAILARFKKELRWSCLGLVALAVVLTLLPLSFGLSLTIWLVWIDLTIVLPMIPYVRGNKALKQLKAAQNWGVRRRGTAVADLAMAAQPEKELSTLHFLFPLLVSLVPVVWAGIKGEWLMAAILLMGPVCVVLFYVLYRWAIRRKAEVVDDNQDLTAALTRVRRRAWRRCWLWGAWFMALFNLILPLSFDHPLWGLILMGVLTVAFTGACVGLEFQLRRLQERLTAASGQGYYLDEDEKWIWGMFYYDPHDSHLMINARVGMNTTVNLARRGGRVVIGVTAAILLLMPLIGVGIMASERAPVEITLTDDALTASHMTSHYVIPLEDIAWAQRVEELPAGLGRVVGTAMDSVLKGRFKSDEYPNLTLCLDPRTGPWMLVGDAEGTVYLLGAGEEGAVYEALTSRLNLPTAPAHP